jgi:hypothetical protein
VYKRISEDNPVLVRSSYFGAKSLSANFFHIAAFEFYLSHFNFYLLIGQKPQKPEMF